MRIIAGKYRGKKILQPKDLTTRPLKDLTKESIFNIYDNIFNQYIPTKKRQVELKLPTIKKLPS